jgi:3-oxoacyl-[acyl-carrier protein] reductase
MGERPVVAITGASRGIGRGLAEFFLERDYAVVGCSRGASTLEAPLYQHATVDVGDEAQVREWVRAIKTSHQRVDVLICNAGLVPAAGFLSVTAGGVMDELLRTNVAGVFYVMREISKLMLRRGYGRIITLSSVAAALHEEGTAAYAASKSAVIELTKVAARELAPRGITCNVIAPSLVMTDAAEALAAHAEWEPRLLERLTIKRRITCAEVGHVAAFLAAPETACVTGQVITLGLVT